MLMGAAYPSAAVEGVWVRSWAPYSPQDVSELSHAVCRQAAGTLVTLARLAEEEHADRSLVEGCPMPSKEARGVFRGREDSALLVDGPRMGGAGQNRRVISPSPGVSKKESLLGE